MEIPITCFWNVSLVENHPMWYSRLHEFKNEMMNSVCVCEERKRSIQLETQFGAEKIKINYNENPLIPIWAEIDF